MSDGDLAMQSWISRLRGVSRDGLRLVAAEAAPLVQKACRATAAAGTSPDGEPWRPKKDGKGAPMVNAASHVTARASGVTIRVELDGPDKWHHYGARGEPRRQVIPEGTTIPAGTVAALDEAASRAFAKLMGGP